MTLTITIEMDNAAFEGDQNTPEVCRILRDYCAKIGRGGELMEGDSENMRDINGNTVGEAIISA